MGRKDGRWEAKCDNGEDIRIRPNNLQKAGRTETQQEATDQSIRRPGLKKDETASLHPCLRTALKHTVRGDTIVASGQITRCAFAASCKVAMEIHKDPPAGVDKNAALLIQHLN